ncbi:M48 family metalloprotease [Baaleninema simplex]|uniref:M48 family metalloprotease n=1 Tax=Baaleninema simplex TaxID=2862350 RepID=UPI000348A4A6|nr:M48 family metalloprotease [Baaleninema simplex]
MKRLRNLLCFLLGTAFFLSLNLFLPNIPLFLRGVVAATPSAQAPQFYPRKSISLKTYPVSEVATEKSQKALNRDRPDSNLQRVAQRQIFQENGSLDNSDDVLRDRSRFDLYDFDGRAGQEIRIQLESRDFDTYLILLGPDDRPLGENDDRARNDPNAELTVTLPRTGTYRIVANAFDARGRGRYTLTVYDLGATSPTASKPDPARVSAPSSGSVSLTREEELLARGDRLYLEGNIAEAQRLYRQVKPPFPREGELQVVEPITEEELSPAARVYWDNVRDGLANDRETQVESSLELLLQEAPGFAPAYKLIAEALLEDDRTEEAIAVLEDATTQFPQSYELARLLAETLRDDGQRLEAAIVAREFAIVNPDHPESEEILELSDRYLRSFRRKLRENIALRGLGGLAVGVLTGRTTSTIFQAINLAQLMVAGESRLGEQVAAQVRQELPMLDDPEVLSYVNDIGQEVAQYMGRDEFDYEFYVVRDNTLNAFALPGGKVFVNTGAIQAARSEAELGGLLGHEVGHAVLSHGFQRIVTNNLLSNLAREIPFGDLLGTLVSLDYSRKHERQSDILGTRVINSAGYAADGLRNFMETLRQEQRGPTIPYLSTHPAPASRVRYMEELIQRNGYERYAFEGVERLAAVKARL